MRTKGLTLSLWMICLSAATIPARASDADQAQIRELSHRFTEAVVSGELGVLDQVFDADPSNVYYDINEGIVSFDRLRRVWQAATRSGRLQSFEFGDDMRIQVDGDRALQTTSWTQTQKQQDGSSQEIAGRATILWKKTADGWRVYHYHGSVTPRRQAQR